jgi:hypothetical protein
MRKRNLLTGILLAASSLAVLALFAAGCESESLSQTDIRISPAYAEVSQANPSVRLTASGWTDYRWSVGNAAYGYLTPRVGDSVTYIATDFSDADFVQTILATADGAGGTTNNSEVLSGEARIRHR